MNLNGYNAFNLVAVVILPILIYALYYVLIKRKKL